MVIVQVVYTRGALLWQQLTSPGGVAQSGRLSYKSKRKVRFDLSHLLVTFLCNVHCCGQDQLTTSGSSILPHIQVLVTYLACQLPLTPWYASI